MAIVARFGGRACGAPLVAHGMRFVSGGSCYRAQRAAQSQVRDVSVTPAGEAATKAPASGTTLTRVSVIAALDDSQEMKEQEDDEEDEKVFRGAAMINELLHLVL